MQACLAAPHHQPDRDTHTASASTEMPHWSTNHDSVSAINKKEKEDESKDQVMSSSKRDGNTVIAADEQQTRNALATNSHTTEQQQQQREEEQQQQQHDEDSDDDDANDFSGFVTGGFEDDDDPVQPTVEVSTTVASGYGWGMHPNVLADRQVPEDKQELDDDEWQRIRTREMLGGLLRLDNPTVTPRMMQFLTSHDATRELIAYVTRLPDHVKPTPLNVSTITTTAVDNEEEPTNIDASASERRYANVLKNVTSGIVQQRNDGNTDLEAVKKSFKVMGLLLPPPAMGDDEDDDDDDFLSTARRNAGLAMMKAQPRMIHALFDAFDPESYANLYHVCAIIDGLMQSCPERVIASIVANKKAGASQLLGAALNNAHHPRVAETLCGLLVPFFDLQTDNVSSSDPRSLFDSRSADEQQQVDAASLTLRTLLRLGESLREWRVVLVLAQRIYDAKSWPIGEHAEAAARVFAIVTERLCVSPCGELLLQPLAYCPEIVKGLVDGLVNVSNHNDEDTVDNKDVVDQSVRQRACLETLVHLVKLLHSAKKERETLDAEAASSFGNGGGLMGGGELCRVLSRDSSSGLCTPKVIPTEVARMMTGHLRDQLTRLCSMLIGVSKQHAGNDDDGDVKRTCNGDVVSDDLSAMETLSLSNHDRHDATSLTRIQTPPLSGRTSASESLSSGNSESSGDTSSLSPPLASTSLPISSTSTTTSNKTPRTTKKTKHQQHKHKYPQTNGATPPPSPQRRQISSTSSSSSSSRPRTCSSSGSDEQAPLGYIRLELVRLVVEIIRLSPRELLSHITPALWSTLVSWLSRFPNSNMYHVLFVKLFGSVVRCAQGSHPALVTLLRECGVVNRFAQELKKSNTIVSSSSSAARGHVLQCLNILRLQAMALPPHAFLPRLLSADPVWCSSLPELERQSVRMALPCDQGHTYSVGGGVRLPIGQRPDLNETGAHRDLRGDELTMLSPMGMELSSLADGSSLEMVFNGGVDDPSSEASSCGVGEGWRDRGGEGKKRRALIALGSSFADALGFEGVRESEDRCVENEEEETGNGLVRNGGRGDVVNGSIAQSSTNVLGWDASRSVNKRGVSSSVASGEDDDENTSFGDGQDDEDNAGYVDDVAEDDDDSWEDGDKNGLWNEDEAEEPFVLASFHPNNHNHIRHNVCESGGYYDDDDVGGAGGEGQVDDYSEFDAYS